MKLAIHQPQYMPWVGYFHKMAGADLFVYLDDVQFKKNEWQHRNRIRSPEGWQWLSVPNTYHFPQRINQVELRTDTRWTEKHLRSIEACYGKAPFFHDYIERFSAFFAEPWSTIDRLNMASTALLADIMGITSPTEVSSIHAFAGVSTERLVNICRHFGAHTYLAGAGGHDYMDLSLFQQAGIAVEFQQFSPPVYPQHWCTSPQDFVAGLSAIDLVFNCGTRSRDVLMSGKGA